MTSTKDEGGERMNVGLQDLTTRMLLKGRFGHEFHVNTLYPLVSLTKVCSVRDIIWVFGKAVERSLGTQPQDVAVAHGHYSEEVAQSLSTLSKNPPTQCHAGYARASASRRGLERALTLDSHE